MKTRFPFNRSNNRLSNNQAEYFKGPPTPPPSTFGTLTYVDKKCQILRQELGEGGRNNTYLRLSEIVYMIAFRAGSHHKVCFFFLFFSVLIY